jgi:hypothetical protein
MMAKVFPLFASNDIDIAGTVAGSRMLATQFAKIIKG